MGFPKKLPFPNTCFATKLLGECFPPNLASLVINDVVTGISRLHPSFASTAIDGFWDEKSTFPRFAVVRGISPTGELFVQGFEGVAYEGYVPSVLDSLSLKTMPQLEEIKQTSDQYKRAVKILHDMDADMTANASLERSCPSHSLPVQTFICEVCKSEGMKKSTWEYMCPNQYRKHCHRQRLDEMKIAEEKGVEHGSDAYWKIVKHPYKKDEEKRREWEKARDSKEK